MPNFPSDFTRTEITEWMERTNGLTNHRDTSSSAQCLYCQTKVGNSKVFRFASTFDRDCEYSEQPLVPKISERTLFFVRILHIKNTLL